jgi:hypothetical protein
LRATKAKLVILGAKQQSVHGISAKSLFEEIDPSVSLIVLDENFEKLDPGECATELLEKVRAIAQPEKTEV